MGRIGDLVRARVVGAATAVALAGVVAAGVLDAVGTTGVRPVGATPSAASPTRLRDHPVVPAQPRWFTSPGGDRWTPDVPDGTPPVDVVADPAPNAGGWYRTAVRYRWRAVDPESGVRHCTSGMVEPVDSPVAISAYGSCTNGAGLAAAYVGFSYRFDGTAPVLRPVVEPAVVEQRGTVVAVPRASDALSGVVRASCNHERRLPTLTLGVHVVTCSATDAAGNVGHAQVRYRVVPARCRDASHTPASVVPRRCADRAG
jgi:hypothetical protein